MAENTTTSEGALDIKSSAPPLAEPVLTNGRDSAGRFTAGNSIGPRFKPGNEVALVHGGRRMLDEVERLAIRDLVLQDLGGSAEVSAVLRELVDVGRPMCAPAVSPKW